MNFGKEKLIEYQNNPSLFRYDVLDTNKRWAKQIEIINAVRDYRNVYVKSCHGIGKTFTAKDVVLWFLYTHYPAVVLTTAPSWAQVEKLLWAEINNAWKNARVNLGGRCLQTEIKIDDNWFAIGISPKVESADDGKRLTGFHSENILVIFDEAPAVNEKLWKIKETLMTSENARFLAIGNPVSDSGYLYEGFRDKNIKSISMNIFDSPNFQMNIICTIEDLQKIAEFDVDKREMVLGEMKIEFPSLATPRWAVDRFLQWGGDSPIFQSRVLGMFPKQTKDTIISFSELEVCKNIEPSGISKNVLGVDVARFGNDNTVIFGYKNWRQAYKEKWNGQDTVMTANVIKHLIVSEKYRVIVIDDTGVGGGVTDIVRDFLDNSKLHDVLLMPINFAQRAINQDEYNDVVTEMYFNAKNLLESRQIQVVDDGSLFAELSKRKYKFTNKGKFKIESKDEYKKRTAAGSPDEADAFILCCYGLTMGQVNRSEDFMTGDDRDTVDGW